MGVCKLEVLGSSSEGNNYILSCGDDVLILECGIGIKKVLNSLKFDITKVRACLCTHR